MYVHIIYVSYIVLLLFHIDYLRRSSGDHNAIDLKLSRAFSRLLLQVSHVDIFFRPIKNHKLILQYFEMLVLKVKKRPEK